MSSKGDAADAARRDLVSIIACLLEQLNELGVDRLTALSRAALDTILAKEGHQQESAS